MLRPGLKPNWEGVRRLLVSRYSVSLPDTSFSSTLERELRSEMGLKLSTEVGSPPLKIGMTLAFLNWVGTTPSIIELLNTCKIGKTIVGIISFKKAVESPKLSRLDFDLSFFNCERSSLLVNGLFFSLNVEFATFALRSVGRSVGGIFF